jgi:RNA polymerase sigma factor, sigma-70 family
MLEMCLALITEESDKEKFTKLYYTYNKFMFSLAMSILHNHALAEETVQDCLLKLAQNMQNVPDVPSKKAQAFIAIMVKNKARNNLELEHHKDTEPIEDHEFISDRMIDEIVTDFGYKRIVQEIEGLDSIYRDVMVMKYVLEKSTNDISELLQIPLRTVETRLYRGRKILKEKLEGMFNEQRV